MISGLFRFLLLVFIGYVIFSFLAFIVRAVTHFIAAQNRADRDRVRQEESRRKRATGGKGDVIELDRDQYKVE